MRGNVLGAFGNGRSLGGGGLGGGGPRLEDLVKAVNDTAAHTMGCEEDGGWVASKISGGARAPMDDFPVQTYSSYLSQYPSRHIFMNILDMKVGLTRARGPHEITCRHAVKSSAVEISKIAKALRWFGLLGCMWLLGW